MAQTVNIKKLVHSPKSKQIGISLSRLALTGIATFSIGVSSIYERYNNYWNKTIFRVQTVDFNILSHTLPTKLSYSILQNQPKELQRTLNSNYNLFGLVVTDPSGQKIIAESRKDNSRSSVTNLQQIQKSPYDLLLDPPPLFPQWSYSHAYSTERTATSFTNRGRVIGRIYYVRGKQPSFQKDFSKWLSNPISQSSRIELYTITMLACLGSGLAFWSLWEYLLYKKRIQKLEAKQKEDALNQQNQTLEIQLVERVNQVELMQEQWEKERSSSTNQAEELRSHNHQLQKEISHLQNTIVSLPAVTSSYTQTELLKIRFEADTARQKQHQQEEQVKQLGQQLQIYQNQLAEIKKQEIEFKELQLQIEETKNARSLAESQIEQLRSSEHTSKQKQQQQEEQVKQLSQQLQAYQNQLLGVNKQGNELKELQLQIEATEQARFLAESQMEQIRNSEHTTKQKQQQQEEQVKQLSKQLQIYQEQFRAVEKQETELKKLQLQIEETKQARSLAESQMEVLRNSESSSRQKIDALEYQLKSEQEVKNQLNKQLEILQRSLMESQQQEQESRLLAQRASQQMEVLSEERERFMEDMGRHPLNEFERAILRSLESSSSQWEIFTQFDTGTGRNNSKFVDFVVVANNCIIAIEAKSYKGIIESVGDARNTNWMCQTNTGKVLINACWGLNPYHQVKTYVDSLMFRVNSRSRNRYSKIPIYGVVVFPKESQINSEIESNVGGYFQITTLDKLLNTINNFDNRAQNQSRLPHQQIVQILTGMPHQIAA